MEEIYCHNNINQICVWVKFPCKQNEEYKGASQEIGQIRGDKSVTKEIDRFMEERDKVRRYSVVLKRLRNFLDIGVEKGRV